MPYNSRCIENDESKTPFTVIQMQRSTEFEQEYQQAAEVIHETFPKCYGGSQAPSAHSTHVGGNALDEKCVRCTRALSKSTTPCTLIVLKAPAQRALYWALSARCTRGRVCLHYVSTCVAELSRALPFCGHLGHYSGRRCGP
jgi:hypothetical protein